MSPARVTAIVGVYHADGGLAGEVRYVVGKVLGRAHCALCDVTHSPVRRKRAWDAMVARLDVPVELVHLDEMSDDVAAVVAEAGSPVVLGWVPAAGAGRWVVLLEAAALETLDGSVDAFEVALHAAIHRL
ncbi:hypothetical protein CLV28_1063 [Sediminihabitans luteus]|uniref:GTPase n=1 Tax=Sediminihabitans luteus TaxID=1138585 RepID=A0A2M9D136_9CELL|nr:hypothetical protein [Sediminihabitans luteus]PJJ77837.1 hypothetical protein CLV28_1063 [Sediminihabitans luteus]GII99805.1 hypothetical protein Slu03_21830 [Sediminihabitans luteus]